MVVDDFYMQLVAEMSAPCFYLVPNALSKVRQVVLWAFRVVRLRKALCYLNTKGSVKVFLS